MLSTSEVCLQPVSELPTAETVYQSSSGLRHKVLEFGGACEVTLLPSFHFLWHVEFHRKLKPGVFAGGCKQRAKYAAEYEDLCSFLGFFFDNESLKDAPTVCQVKNIDLYSLETMWTCNFETAAQW